MFVRAMFWKEVREHRLQALMLVGMAAGVLFLLQAFEPDFSANAFRATLSASFAWACGMVTGAILLANESESMTQTFLDQLPRSRRQVWWSKCFFGLTLTVVQAGILSAACLTLRRNGETSETPSLILLMNLLGGLFGLSCGLFGSSMSRNVLSAIGWSVVALFGSLLYGLICFALLAALSRTLKISERAEPELTFLAFLFSLPMPMVLSSWLYTSLDRRRGIASRYRLLPRFGFSPGGFGLKQILWLSFRQGWALQLFLGVMALVGSILLLIEPLVVWPLVTLFLGLFAGVGVVGDEQFYGSFRLLAEQRLPLNRFWLTKVASRLLVAVGLAALMLIVALIGRELVREIGGHNLNATWRDERWVAILRRIGPTNFLIASLFYGFAFGHLIGLFARKTFVAFAVGLAVSHAVLSLWVPSLISGGVPAWQVLALPITMLVAARLSIWKWATDRLYSRQSLLLCGAFAAAALGFLGLSLANRVWETPNVAAPFDVAAFESAYPLRVENDVRSKLIQTDELFRAQRSKYSQLFDNRNPQFAGVWSPAIRRDMLSVAISTGWPKNEPELDRAVRTACEGGWLPVVQEVAALPPAVVDDPRDLAISTLAIADRLGTMTPWLAARALQMQAAGDHEAALNLISVLLSLARHVETRSAFRSYIAGWRIESTALQSLKNWSRDPNVPPALLQRSLQLLREHEARTPPFEDNIKAEYLLQRDLLAERMSPYRSQNESGHRDWHDFLRVPTNVAPWEKTRRERLFNACFSLMLQSASVDYPTLFNRAQVTQTDDAVRRRIARTYQLLPVTKDDSAEALKQALAPLIENDDLIGAVPYLHRTAEALRFRRLCQIRGTEIRLALLAYQHGHGKPAENLEQLTPDLLAAVPIDPYSERAFNYRLIDKEEWVPWRQQVFPGAADWGIEGASNMGGFPMGAMGGGMGGPPGGPMGNSGPQSKMRPVTATDEGATHRRLKPGYAVVWSVGADTVNDGGTRNSEFLEHPVDFARGGRAAGFDILFVVPRIK